MATNGSKTIAVTSWNNLVFSWNISSQSIASNTSTITWSLKLVSTSSGAISSTASKSWWVNVNGSYYEGTNTVGIAANSTKILASGTTVIKHNDNGTKSFDYSFSQYFGITFSGSWIESIGGSGSGTLDTIPRASNFTISEGTLGVAQNISVTRQSTAFTHGLTYSCGGVKTQLICAWNTTAQNVSFTPPLDLAWQAVNGNRVWVDIHLQTYDSSGTPIGNVVTKGIWMSIPASVKPSCSLTVSDPTGYAAKFGAYIQGQSKLTIKVTPQTAYGSPIVGYLVGVDGDRYTTAEVTTPVIKSTGSVEVYADVTDTRGRLGAASTTLNVLAYTRPVITTLKVHRCNQDGTENDRGLYGKVTYSYNIDTLSGKNDMSGFIQYKKSTDSEYTTHELSKAFNMTNGTFIFAADDGSTYDVQLLIADSFVSVGHRTTLSTAFTLIHYAPDGKGITFGGIRNKDGINIVNMPFRINDVEVDYIVEQGEIDGWFYRKWNGGFAECWKIYYGYGINSAKNNYSGFYYSETITVQFPFTFTNLPTVTVDGGSVNYINFVRVFGKYSDKASFSVVSMIDAGNVDVTVDIKAIGRWK
jgi:hypothetical protein